MPLGSRWVRALPLTALLAASVLFHLPPLLNYRGVHSDAAVVGLQARHVLQGEWSWHLWGVNYQGAVEPLLVAAAFAMTGPNAFTLMAVPFLGHLLLVALVFSTLRLRLSDLKAFLASLPLVVTPHAVNSVALYAHRQWSITLVFLSVWLLDRAGRLKRPWLIHGVGLFLGVFSLYLDQYTLQFMPALGIFALMCALDGSPPFKARLARVGGGALGAIAGAVLVSVLQRTSAAMPSPVGLSLAPLARNLELLWSTCLPFLLGAKVFIPGMGLYPDLWNPPTALQWFQTLGASILPVAILFGGVAILWRAIPWEIRRLGFFGFTVAGTSIAGFLLSSMPADLWAVRYLAAVVRAAPLALAPPAHLLRPRSFGLAMSPYLVVAAIGGWLSYGRYVSGPLPALDARGVAREEERLGQGLRERGVTAAAAQYWLAYRLSFLFDENPIVIPLGEDRYPPYRSTFERSREVAFIFHPSEPRAQPGPYEEWLRRSGARYERLEISGFTVLLHHR